MAVMQGLYRYSLTNYGAPLRSFVPLIGWVFLNEPRAKPGSTDTCSGKRKPCRELGTGHVVRERAPRLRYTVSRARIRMLAIMSPFRSGVALLPDSLFRYS